MTKMQKFELEMISGFSLACEIIVKLSFVWKHYIPDGGSKAKRKAYWKMKSNKSCRDLS